MKVAALLTLLALPLSAASLPKLSPLCGQLRKDGWTAPNDPISGKPLMAEMSVPGVMYLCSLQRVLPRSGGTGHPPDLQALLSYDGTTSEVIFSADVWCEGDQKATLDALVTQTQTALGVALPESIVTAIRSAKPAKATVDGLAYEILPVAVDANACRDVAPGQLGPVLFKVDVAVRVAR